MDKLQVCCCGKLAKVTCSACHVVNYCSRDCQSKDWPAHRLACIRVDVSTPSSIKTQQRESLGQEKESNDVESMGEEDEEVVEEEEEVAGEEEDEEDEELPEDEQEVTWRMVRAAHDTIRIKQDEECTLVKAEWSVFVTLLEGWLVSNPQRHAIIPSRLSVLLRQSFGDALQWFVYSIASSSADEEWRDFSSHMMLRSVKTPRCVAFTIRFSNEDCIRFVCTELPDTLAPPELNLSGPSTAKKKREREEGDGPKVYKCGNCKAFGHNKRACPDLKK